jgi:hypothetical protein
MKHVLMQKLAEAHRTHGELLRRNGRLTAKYKDLAAKAEARAAKPPPPPTGGKELDPQHSLTVPSASGGGELWGMLGTVRACDAASSSSSSSNRKNGVASKVRKFVPKVRSESLFRKVRSESSFRKVRSESSFRKFVPKVRSLSD